ncbi:hypothetical protein GCM10023107_60920 [Actinoplanes octamycinicus]|nr:hypothetical protein Aoc01nite_11500 [Actinoplanes octamycinicus]
MAAIMAVAPGQHHDRSVTQRQPDGGRSGPPLSVGRCTRGAGADAKSTQAEADAKSTQAEADAKLTQAKLTQAKLTQTRS